MGFGAGGYEHAADGGGLLGREGARNLQPATPLNPRHAEPSPPFLALAPPLLVGHAVARQS
eukprot:1807612-Rhodomonas_salina.1